MLVDRTTVVLAATAGVLVLLAWYVGRRDGHSMWRRDGYGNASKMGIFDLREFDELHPELKDLLSSTIGETIRTVCVKVSRAWNTLSKEEREFVIKESKERQRLQIAKLDSQMSEAQLAESMRRTKSVQKTVATMAPTLAPTLGPLMKATKAPKAPARTTAPKMVAK